MDKKNIHGIFNLTEKPSPSSRLINPTGVYSADLNKDGLITANKKGIIVTREIPDANFISVSGDGNAANHVGELGPGPIGTSEEMGWDNKTQFFLSVIGYSVGLGNIWRFPYLVQQNGGGAFLIPFLIMIFLVGAPLLLIELSIGQRLRTGSLGVWTMIHPMIGGIGIASTIVAFLVGLYYNVIITWCFFFLFQSFQAVLPWETCPIIDKGMTFINGSTINGSLLPVPECEKSSETAYFWYRKALDISPSIDETGGLKWWLVLCLLLAWIVVYIIIMRGIKSSGKVVYFTALFPYAILTIFFIRGLTLKGSGAGLLHMYTPKMSKLLELNVWLDAATQVFYSFGVGFGSLIAFGSYNKARNNCVKDTIFITVTNALTAIFASAVIFSVLGFKATVIHEKCIDHNKMELSIKYPGKYSVDMSEAVYLKAMNELFPNAFYRIPEPFRTCSLEDELDTAAAGTGLAFVVFTQAIVELPWSPFWSIIFFMMLLALGLGSQIGTMEGVVNTMFESSVFSKIRKEILTGIICLVSFLCGLIFVTGAGQYWVGLFDSYASTTGLVIIALLETVTIMHIYGHERFSSDIEYMTGYYPGIYWQVTWRFIGPTILSGLLIGSFVSKLQYSPNYMAWDGEKVEHVYAPYPSWVMAIAYTLICIGILPIIVVAIMSKFNCILGRSRRDTQPISQVPK